MLLWPFESFLRRRQQLRLEPTAVVDAREFSHAGGVFSSARSHVTSCETFDGAAAPRGPMSPPAALNNVSHRTCRQAIAEDAIALLEAFVDRDIDEVLFRTGLLRYLAEQTYCAELCEASRALQDASVGGRRMRGERTLPRALVERVIATAADAVTTVDGR